MTCGNTSPRLISPQGGNVWALVTLFSVIFAPKSLRPWNFKSVVSICAVWRIDIIMVHPYPHLTNQIRAQINKHAKTSTSWRDTSTHWMFNPLRTSRISKLSLVSRPCTSDVPPRLSISAFIHCVIRLDAYIITGKRCWHVTLAGCRWQSPSLYIYDTSIHTHT